MSDAFIVSDEQLIEMVKEKEISSLRFPSYFDLTDLNAWCFCNNSSSLEHRAQDVGRGMYSLCSLLLALCSLLVEGPATPDEIESDYKNWKNFLVFH